MLQIIIDGYKCPDTTYFRTSAAEPELERDEQGQQVLKLVNGRGTYKGSATPQVSSADILDTENLVAIHVGFSHRHGGSQFWRYYRHDGQEWAQVTWAQLSDEERNRILIAHEDRSPSWAKVPGKLRANYMKPVMQTKTAYKIVQVIDGRYYSVYDGKTEYIVGKRLAEKAVDDHGGGYYSYPSIDVEAQFMSGLFPGRCYDDPMTLALIECEISGTIIKYGSKWSSTYLRPTRILKTFEYVPEVQKVG